MFERKSVIVHFRNPKALRKIEPFGHISYFHKKRRYAVVYIDGDKAEETIAALEKLRHVKKVEMSPLYDVEVDMLKAVK